MEGVQLTRYIHPRRIMLSILLTGLSSYWCEPTPHRLPQLSNPSSKNSSSSDIEELCTTCDPLPTSTQSVTRFPMKVDKKKARVETSVVCPMCWISPKGDEWWLMTKRPATGTFSALCSSHFFLFFLVFLHYYISLLYIISSPYLVPLPIIIFRLLRRRSMN